jgi:16S rRNA (guanine966-N2)-methyltransferase
MRIISGLHKGRRLKTLAGQRVRPTSDRLRETLFNVLAPRIAGASFLDLCAGSGAVGIEAVSRGASRVVFVESSRRAASLIDDNLDHCGIEDDVEVIDRDVLSALKVLATREDRFDIIFLDPPYDSEIHGSALRLISEKGLLAENGLVIVEHRKGSIALPSYGNLRPYREIVHGDSALTFYSLEERAM